MYGIVLWDPQQSKLSTSNKKKTGTNDEVHI
jgi:hypothetical protein